MTTTSDAPASEPWNALHHALLALLIASRPLIWDGEPGQPAALAWYALVAIGLVALGGELLAGLRRTWTWSPAGLLAALAVALLVPAGWHSPQAFAGLSDLGQLLGHLAFAIYCSQVMIGRERTAIAALLAGLGMEAVYALGQQVLVLPAMAQQVQTGSDLGVPAGLRGDLVERLQNGGVYGTFTLSNALAGYLLLAVPLAVGAAVVRNAMAMRIAAGIIALGGLAALACTNSKGAWIAAILASAVVAPRLAPGRWRWAVPAVVALGIAVVLAVPTLRERLSASADVRLGYWQAAKALITERPWTGYGIGGFAAESPRVMAIGAEYSRHTHNEVLEAAVAGGVLAGVAVAGFFAILALRRTREPAIPANDPPVWLPAVVVLGLAYLHIFGLLPAGGFPGCDGDLDFVFLLPFLILAGGLMAILRRVTTPPWAIGFALTAVVLHCLQDFDLRSGGVLGTLATVACLGATTRSGAIGRIGACIPWIAAIALLIGLAVTVGRSGNLRDAQALVARVQDLDQGRTQAESLDTAVRSLHLLLALPEPDAAALAPRHLLELRQQAVDRAWSAAQAVPAPAETLGSVLNLLPASRERLPRSSLASTAFPHSAMLHGMLADDLAAAGQWHEALAAAREAVRRSPWRLSYRLRLATLLERCAAAEADPALLAEAQAERARIDELQPRVHFRDRLPSGAR